LALVSCFGVLLAPISRFNAAFDTGYMFSRVWYLTDCIFPALGVGFMFWCVLLAPVSRFNAAFGCLLFHACHFLHVFPRLVPIPSFPALGARHRLIVFVFCFFCD